MFRIGGGPTMIRESLLPGSLTTCTSRRSGSARPGVGLGDGPEGVERSYAVEATSSPSAVIST